MSDTPMKNVCVVSGQSTHDVAIQPGTTVPDVLAECGLPGDFWLTHPNGVRVDENLYEDVNDGGKLTTVTSLVVAFFKRSFKKNNSTLKTSKSKDGQIDTITSKTRNVVKRNTLPLYLERGWIESKGKLFGLYKVSDYKLPGEIVLGEYPNFYVQDRTGILSKGHHHLCFRECSNRTNWFSIHFSPTPRDPNSGITAVEQLLRESL